MLRILQEAYGVNESIAKTEDYEAQMERLATLSEEVIQRCRRAGASQAEVGASIDVGLNVTVRMGEVETIEHNRDRSFGITVYFGQRKGSASTADLHPDSITATIDHACAIARYTEADPCTGLADADLMAREFSDLDLWHPWKVAPAQAIELATEIETAGREFDARISNSEGASVQAGETLAVYANSHGFVGRERATRHTLSCALIAEDKNGMQRDYWYESVRSADDFPDMRQIGERAAQRTVKRLSARQLGTCTCPVLFAPEVARGLIGHFLSAVSGGALYRKASFLVDHAGKRVFPDFVEIFERPHVRRGQGSSLFDTEGVATYDSDLIRGGILQRYVLSSYSARKLGLKTTANAGGIHNIVVKPGTDDFPALLKKLDTGLVVTDVMGQGVSIITGDYSRGASGFWVENGEIAYPVEEITIASNLREMFNDIVVVGKDVDPRSSILTGSLLVEKMTVGGT